MDETIGVKGGTNDRKRSMRIAQKKKKEQEEIKELEQRVKRKTPYILIKTIPIVIVGGTLKTFYDVATGKKNYLKDDVESSWRIKEYDADISSKSRQEEAAEKKREQTVTVKLEDGQKIKVKVPQERPTQEVRQDYIPLPTTQIQKRDDEETSEIKEDELPETVRVRFQKLKAHKIVDTYEEQLKEARYDLRNLAADYKVLEKQSEEATNQEEVDEVLDKLSEVIDRIEELKRRISIEDLEQYDDNYIYTLIEGYLSDFQQGNQNEEVEDSSLYVLISSKLQELEEEREELDKKVKLKKEKLEAEEIHLDELREKYYSLDKINQELLDFQREQERLLQEVKEKIANAVSIEEKTRVEVRALNRQSRRLLNLLSLQMFFPGPRGARRAATAAAAYLYFFNQLSRPQTTTKQYRVITVKDYSGEIEQSMEALNDASNLLQKTETQIDKMIAEIETTYQEYIGVVSECDQLLASLYQIRGDIREKEYEMQKIKEEQEYLMEKNDAKVKRRGEYEM